MIFRGLLSAASNNSVVRRHQVSLVVKQQSALTPMMMMTTSTPIKASSYSSTTTLLMTSSTAQEKLRTILEEYRLANYQQTIPSRFVKEIVDAADANNDGFVEYDEIRQFFENIGVDNTNKLSDDELAELRKELELKNPVPVEDLKEFLNKIFVSGK